MKILHISDAHIVNFGTAILDKLLDTIAGEHIDLCLFTGDMVNKFNFPLMDAYTHLRASSQCITAIDIAIWISKELADQGGSILSLRKEYLGSLNDSFGSLNTEHQGKPRISPLFKSVNQAIIPP